MSQSILGRMSLCLLSLWFIISSCAVGDTTEKAEPAAESVAELNVEKSASLNEVLKDQKPVVVDSCQPNPKEQVCRLAMMSACGKVDAGCPDQFHDCGCEQGLICQDGACMPIEAKCQPKKASKVCKPNRCGEVYSGCPGKKVRCGCKNGFTCQRGECVKARRNK